MRFLKLKEKYGIENDTEMVRLLISKEYDSFQAMEHDRKILERALANPEIGPVLWKALEELEEKAEKASRGPAS